MTLSQTERILLGVANLFISWLNFDPLARFFSYPLQNIDFVAVNWENPNFSISS